MILTYTLVNDFQNCPRKAWHKYVAKDLPKETSPALEWGVKVHSALEKRIAEGRVLPGDMPYEHFASAFGEESGRSVRCEAKLAIDTTGSKLDFFDRTGNAWVRGKVDVLVHFADTALIFDWKTGKVREDTFELEVYALLAKCNYPGLTNIRGAYVWLAENRMGKLHDLNNHAATFNTLKGVQKEIDALDPKTEWPAHENPLCGWCPVKKCEYNRSGK